MSTQTQKILLEGLARLDPRARLLEQSLSCKRVERNQTEQSFVMCRRIGELSRTSTGLPTGRAEALSGSDTKPMLVLRFLIAQPLQGLALGADDRAFGFEGRND